MVGFCQLYPSFCSVIAQPIFTLYDLYVAPPARQTGAGRALMQAAHDHALQNGFARLDLSTARSSHKAQALYESWTGCATRSSCTTTRRFPGRWRRPDQVKRAAGSYALGV